MKEYIEILGLIGISKISFETVFRLEIIAVSIQLILILVLFFLNFNSFKKYFRIIRKAWLYLFILLLLGLALRLEYGHTHNQDLYGDEAFHLRQAENIKLTFQNDPCYVEYFHIPGLECEFVQHFPLPYSFFVFSFSFLFDSFETSAFFVSFLFGLLSVFLMFFLAYFLFKNEIIALFAALFASFFSLFVEFSNAPVDYMASIFFIGLSVILILMAVKLGSWRSCLLACFVSIFTFMIRFENTFLLALLLFFILIRKGDKKKFISCFLIAALFYIPFFLYIFHPLALNPINVGMGEYLGLKISPSIDFSPIQISLPNTLPTIKVSYLQVLFQNFYFTWKYEAHFLFWILGLIGFIYLFKNNKTCFFFLAFWFLTFFLFYAWFNISEYVCILDRFIFCYTPFVIASAAGMFYLLQKGYCFFRKSKWIIFLLLILVVLGNINFLIHSSGKTGFNEKYSYLASQGYMRGCVFEEPLKDIADSGFLNVKMRLVKDLVKDSEKFVQGLKQFFLHKVKLVKLSFVYELEHMF